MNGYQTGSDDRHYIAKRLAMAKQMINVGNVRKAVVMLNELYDDGQIHSDISYMLGECHRRLCMCTGLT